MMDQKVGDKLAKDSEESHFSILRFIKVALRDMWWHYLLHFDGTVLSMFPIYGLVLVIVKRLPP